MNSSLVAISTLVKSNVGEKCLVSFLMNVSALALRDYLKLADAYKRNGTKNKTKLIEMIVYGCITNKLNREEIEDISINHVHQILNKNGILINSLPGYQNSGLKENYIKTCTNIKVSVIQKPSIKVIELY